MARWPSINNTETMKRIEEDVLSEAQAYVKTYVGDRPGRNAAPTVNDAWQLIKMEIPLEYVLNMPKGVFVKVLGCVSGGGGFFDDVSTYDQAQRLGKWLGMDADAILDGFEGTEIADKYMACAWKGFKNQIDAGVKDGYHVEFNPVPTREERENIRQTWPSMNTAVRVYENGTFIGDVLLPCRQAATMYSVLREDTLDNGSILQMLKNIAADKYDRYSYPMAWALRDFGKAMPYVKEAEKLIDQFSRGEIGEDSYYKKMGALDARMRGDESLSVLTMECVDMHADRYFKTAYNHETSKAYRDARSGRCMPAPGADKPARAERATVSKDAALAKSAARTSSQRPPIRKQKQTK